MQIVQEQLSVHAVDHERNQLPAVRLYALGVLSLPKGLIRASLSAI